MLSNRYAFIALNGVDRKRAATITQRIILTRWQQPRSRRSYNYHYKKYGNRRGEFLQAGHRLLLLRREK